MARPKQAQVRDQKVTVRLTPEEVVQLRERAAKLRTSITEFVRRQVLDGRKKRRQTVKTADRHPLEQLEPGMFHELRRIGVNLNQIARHCNRYQLPPPAGTDEAMRELLAILNRTRPAA